LGELLAREQRQHSGMGLRIPYLLLKASVVAGKGNCEAPPRYTAGLLAPFVGCILTRTPLMEPGEKWFVHVHISILLPY